MSTIQDALKILTPAEESQVRDKNESFFKRIVNRLISGDSSSLSIFENEASEGNSNTETRIVLDFSEFILAADKEDKNLQELLKKIQTFPTEQLILKLDFSKSSTDNLIAAHQSLLLANHPFWLLLKLGHQKAIEFNSFFSSFVEPTTNTPKTAAQTIANLMRSALRANTNIEMIRLSNFHNESAVTAIAHIIASAISAHAAEKNYTDNTNPSFLRYIFFEDVSMSHEALHVIIKAVPANDEKFYSLGFVNCNISKEKLNAIVAALDNPMIKRLKLDDNSIREGIITLAEKLKKNNSLLKLWIRNNHIGEGSNPSQEIAKLAEALRENSTLIELYLGGKNAITKDDFIKLINALKVNKTVNLHFSYMQVSSFYAAPELNFLSNELRDRLIVDGAPAGFRFGEEIPVSSTIKTQSSDSLLMAIPKESNNLPKVVAAPKASSPPPIASERTTSLQATAVKKKDEKFSPNIIHKNNLSKQQTSSTTPKTAAVGAVASTLPLFNNAVQTKEANNSRSRAGGVKALVEKMDKLDAQTTGSNFVQPRDKSLQQ